VSSQIAAPIRPCAHGTTFGGGPFLASLANSRLARLSDPELLKHVEQAGAWFGKRLTEMARRNDRIRTVRGIGFMWGIDVAGLASQVVHRAFDAGLLVCSAGDYTVRLLPPLVATREELAAGLTILEDAF